MARYSCVRGPAVVFELTGVRTLIPGFVIARTFGRGPLLVGYTVAISNFSGISIFVTNQVFLDGVGLNHSLQEVDMLNLGGAALSWTGLLAVDDGFHSLDLRIKGNAAVGDTLFADNSNFFVIELPAWDQEDDLITL